MTNQNNKSNKHMLIMMAVCCLVLIALILFFGIGGLTLGLSGNWVIGGALLLMVAVHIFMMKGHNHNQKDTDDKKS
tara:strand:+ start:2908 stop:3135 length:228 start_codon:yes stop_codon:yes gene_type:complete